MTAPVAQFENRLSSNADVPHSHDHGDGHAGHSHDQAAEEHGHTHEHMEHAGESLPAVADCDKSRTSLICANLWSKEELMNRKIRREGSTRLLWTRLDR
jgi:uncharacterized protein involved in copper resistance